MLLAEDGLARFLDRPAPPEAIGPAGRAAGPPACCRSPGRWRRGSGARCACGSRSSSSAATSLGAADARRAATHRGGRRRPGRRRRGPRGRVRGAARRAPRSAAATSAGTPRSPLRRGLRPGAPRHGHGPWSGGARCQWRHRQGAQAVRRRRVTTPSFPMPTRTAWSPQGSRRGCIAWAGEWASCMRYGCSRDDTDLTASPDLWGRVTEAMDRSRYMVVVLSPRALASHWVNQELSYWLERRGSAEVLLVLADGEVVWDQEHGRFDPDRSDAALEALTRPGVFVRLWDPTTEPRSGNPDRPFGRRGVGCAQSGRGPAGLRRWRSVALVCVVGRTRSLRARIAFRHSGRWLPFCRTAGSPSATTGELGYLILGSESCRASSYARRMRLRGRMAAVIVLVALGGALSACGDEAALTHWGSSRASGSSASDSEPRSWDSDSAELPYTGEQVFRLFYMSGLYLARGERWDQIASTMSPASRSATPSLRVRQPRRMVTMTRSRYRPADRPQHRRAAAAGRPRHLLVPRAWSAGIPGAGPRAPGTQRDRDWMQAAPADR